MRVMRRWFMVVLALVAAISVVGAPALASPGGRQTPASADRGAGAPAATMTVIATDDGVQVAAAGSPKSAAPGRDTSVCDALAAHTTTSGGQADRSAASAGAAAASGGPSVTRTIPGANPIATLKACQPAQSLGPTGSLVRESGARPAASPRPARPATSRISAANATLTISGKVTNSSGTALEGISVTIEGNNDWNEGVTLGDGTFSIPAMADTYVVRFRDDTQSYADGYYSSAGWVSEYSSATSVTVGAASLALGTIKLPRAFKVSGKIVGAGAVPLEGIQVSVVSGTYEAYGQTALDGTFSIGVVNGTYTLGVYDWTSVYANGWWSSGGFTRSESSATAITVASANRSGLNMTLPKNPRILGTVKGVGGVLLANIEVRADMTQAPWDGFNTTTSTGGTFAMSVAPGTYTLSFGDPAQVYADGNWTAAGYSADRSDEFTVGSTDVSGFTVTLPKAIHIKGTVKSSGGIGIAGLSMEANGNNGNGYSDSGPGGVYSMAVRPGIYSLSVADNGTPTVYASGFWSGTGFTLDSGASGGIIVTTADVTVNLTVPKLVHIKGKVTGPGGVALAGIEVYSSAGSDLRTATAADGTYSLPVPASRNWSVQFYDPAEIYQSGFWKSTGLAADASTAGSIVVGTADVGGYNVQLPALRRITGKVTKAGGTGVPDINVYAMSASYTSRATTLADGTYSLGVPAGSYTVFFRDGNEVYAPGYYGAAGYSYDTSKAVAISAANVGGVSVQLPAMAVVSGTVTSTGGLALGGITVEMEGDHHWSPMGSDTWARTTTAPNGTYSLKVAPGPYVLSFYDEASVYTSEYYAGASLTLDRARAARLAVGTSAISGANAKLPKNLHITGKVTGSGGVALKNIHVTATSTLASAYATTAADGTYSLAVPAGKYRVEFDDWNAEPAYYSTTGTKADANAASAVTVTTANVGSINGVFTPASRTISGIVTGAGAAGLPGVEVCAVNAVARAARMLCGRTSPTGAFTISVRPGTYYLEVERPYSFIGSGAWGGMFAGGYWSSSGLKSSMADATAITVGASNVTGRNMTLPRLVHVSGRVTAPNGVGIAGMVAVASGTNGYSRGMTGPDGRYTLSLAADTYTVMFDSFWMAIDWAWGWYGASGYTSTSPKSITVASTAITGIDVRMPKPVWLGGKVVRSGPHGMSGISVQATSSVSTQPYAYSAAYANADGGWWFLVPPGSYRISYTDDWYMPFSFGRIPNGFYATTGFTLAESAASVVSVSTTSKLAVNVTAPLGRRISGFVTDAKGLPLYGAKVTATTTGYSVTGWTNELGAYTVPVTAAGYKLRFEDPSLGHGSGYYSSTGLVASAASATSVSTATVDKYGITVALPLDTTAPTAAAPTTSFRTGAALSGSTMPVTVSLSGTDNSLGSGVYLYQVRKSTNGGSTWGTPTGWVSGPTFATTVAASGTARFSVRALDFAGNAGAWVSGSTLTPALAQTGSGVTYGGTWSTSSNTAYSGGSTRYASTAGASATYSFTGRSVALVMTKASSRGAVRIYVDGSSSYTTVDTYASSAAYQVLVWQKTWPTAGSHKVKVVVVGTSGRPRVDLDAIALLK